MKSANELLLSKSHQKWAPLMELASKEVFELMLGSELGAPSGEVAAVMDMTAMVGLAGQLCGVLSVRCNQATAARMAGKMLGSQPDVDSQEVKDAIGEVCNMIAGNFKTKLSGMGGNCMLSVPTVITGSDYSLHSLGDSEALEVALLFEGLPFVVTLDIHN